MGTQEVFNEDLKEWQVIEREFAELLKANNPDSEIKMAPDKYFPDWDIIVSDNVRYEIKYDRKAMETGNIAIEVAYKGKPSGIFNSLADFVVYKIGDEFRIKGRLTLIRAVDNYKTDMGWDNDNSELILMSVEKAKEIFTLYK